MTKLNLLLLDIVIRISLLIKFRFYANFYATKHRRDFYESRGVILFIYLLNFNYTDLNTQYKLKINQQLK